jgi:hypothetical protein
MVYSNVSITFPTEAGARGLKGKHYEWAYVMQLMVAQAALLAEVLDHATSRSLNHRRRS